MISSKEKLLGSLQEEVKNEIITLKSLNDSVQKVNAVIEFIAGQFQLTYSQINLYLNTYKQEQEKKLGKESSNDSYEMLRMHLAANILLILEVYLKDFLLKKEQELLFFKT